MEMLLNKSNSAQNQAHYLALSVKYRERARRCSDRMVAAGYTSLADGYELLARSLGTQIQLPGRTDKRAEGEAI
jgi:hypothetical protein